MSETTMRALETTLSNQLPCPRIGLLDDTFEAQTRHLTMRR